jgi:hypothetical protein
MANDVLTVRNVFCLRKDYSSFLGGKLIVFKLCNMKLCWQMYDVIFRIILDYFIVY